MLYFFLRGKTQIPRFRTDSLRMTHQGINVRKSRILQLIRQKIVRNRYQITAHALDEMRQDALTIVDVKHAIRRGRIRQRFTHDPRGTRYRIQGPARDGRVVNVICRVLDSEELRIITVYAEE